MIKLVMGLGGAGLATLATVLAVALAGTPDPVATVGTLPPPAAEISGPCDEAEHATDPRCTGVARADRRDDDVAGETGPTGVSGPSGVIGPSGETGEDDRGDDDHGEDDDRSGPGGRGGDDDRSGSNSGRG